LVLTYLQVIMTYTSLDYNYIKPCFDYDYDYDKRIFIFIYVTMTKLKIIMDFDYLNYVTKKQNLRNSMGRLSIKNLVKPWALGRVQKKSVENSTLGWVGVSGVGQNPQNQV